jgi:hypothetical protein
MTIEYLDQLQPRILDVQQKVVDVGERPGIRVDRRCRAISGTLRQVQRSPIRSGGGWLLVILIALVVGAIASQSTQQSDTEPQAVIANPTTAPAIDPSTPANSPGASAVSDATQAPTPKPHTPIKCVAQQGAENSPDITLPDVVGQNAKAAGEQLSQIGLLNVQLTSANPNYTMVLVAANWTVVSTNPAPCSVITRHDHVVLHVTKPGRGVGSLFEFPWSR